MKQYFTVLGIVITIILVAYVVVRLGSNDSNELHLDQQKSETLIMLDHNLNVSVNIKTNNTYDLIPTHNVHQFNKTISESNLNINVSHSHNIKHKLSQHPPTTSKHDHSTITTKPDHSDSASHNINFNEARNNLKKVLSLIRNRYELSANIGKEFFLTANNIGADTWDILKYKFAYKMASQNSTFLMTFGGSSVTAGHDNYYNQSYPYIFEKRMKDSFKLLGIDLIVHNIALGANNCAPYILCYETMGGINPDFVGWEQSYNCGRDEPIFEAAARIAGWNELEKGVIYYSASGAWSPSDCPPSTDQPPYCSEEWTPDKANLEEWNPSITDIHAEKEQLTLYHSDRSSVVRSNNYNNNNQLIRFTGGWTSHYKGIGIHGFNVWEKNKHNSCVKDNKTIHDCAAIDVAQKCSLKFMTKEASWYGSDDHRGANWHPTRAFHMLRGEAIVWLYALILMDSMHMVEEDLATRTMKAMQQEYYEKLHNLQHPLPHPKRCNNLHCEKKPLCYTDFRPHYSINMNLSELVVGKTKWFYDAEPYGEWSLHYGYLDAKPLYKADTFDMGEIHILININSSNFVWLCGGSAKDSLAHSVVYLDKDVSHDIIMNRSIYVPTEHRELWTDKKYIGFECKEIQNIPPGLHVLSISHNTTFPKHTLVLSHVIMWP
eukprot:gene7904-10729_t